MLNLLGMLLFQSELSPEQNAAAGAIGGVAIVVWLAFVILIVAAMWKIFVKAGEPGWAAIVPIYNLIVMLKIAGKPAWWIVLMLIPFVNIVVMIIMLVALAQSFGKGVGFALGMLFLPFIFYPMLAWGDARYQGPPAPSLNPAAAVR
jgi:hypothetical protein